MFRPKADNIVARWWDGSLHVVLPPIILLLMVVLFLLVAAGIILARLLVEAEGVSYIAPIVGVIIT